LEEARKIAQSSTNIREYVRQSIAEFVTSARDINNDRAWNDYITELNNMGLQTWLSASQTAFDRMK
jgi:putative aldouronate transport system substrate-binding protein